ncbi:MAG: PLP-dependent aminotransferase family protein [Cohaesibacteraceae bacterium]|nr:PLP-dependent aminotransferase family protein [Cohaesibacteraceae bacterium]MBL4875339.1 PLP-dependent aminotransferase family protein [Cohaesibacteraceae bacterium]
MDHDFKTRQTEDGTLVDHLCISIGERIASRALTRGNRLPSIRQAARDYAVSKSTVVEAYDRLVAQGQIEARKGSGFYVTGHIAPLSVAAMGPPLERAIDPLWVSRQSLDAGDDYLKPGCGWLPASWMPQDGMRRALRALARDSNASLADYARPRGFTPLREHISQRLIRQDIIASPAQILLTDSGTQAIDLLCRFLLEPGDTVLIDDPCYFNFRALLTVHRANLVSVPFTTGGPDIDQLEQILKTARPKFYLTNSALHNPTGASLTPLVAHKVLKLADRYDLIILEDDVFADFEHEPAPRLAAFDGLERVIHLSGFSKTHSAAARCGYIAARPDWIEGMIDLKIATSFGGTSINPRLLHHHLTDGGHFKFVEQLRTRLASAMSRTIARLEQLGIKPWIIPKGGMYLWCHLPAGCDAADLAQKALKQKIILAPGNVFSLAGSATEFMRFNVSQCDDQRLFEVLEELIG